ncbi:hypothetical protein C8F04DRAFT_1103675 [Mycena alexandri]|uniref:Uncharacterized protein n=1 Tax=Mycena alexandri TaxID=1745969 RepID=A0AAD6ST95_9AGAR|nr:hypothetical protein C8F04DRAFT_1103675 [Mycena alexandri]
MPVCSSFAERSTLGSSIWLGVSMLWAYLEPCLTSRKRNNRYFTAKKTQKHVVSAWASVTVIKNIAMLRMWLQNL